MPKPAQENVGWIWWLSPKRTTLLPLRPCALVAGLGGRPRIDGCDLPAASLAPVRAYGSGMASSIAGNRRSPGCDLLEKSATSSRKARETLSSPQLVSPGRLQPRRGLLRLLDPVHVDS